jgi:protocatechuate 3,4-dioxygenase beta subunit
MAKRHVALAAVACAAVVGWAGGVQAGPPASGLRPGETVEPWNPLHVAGPDRGTNTCPVCTYLEKPVVVVFAKDTPNTAALTAKLEALAAEKRKTGLRVVVAVVDAGPERLARLAADLKIAGVALCHLNPKTREKDLRAYKIDPAAENTVMVYKDYTVTDTLVDLPAASFDRVAAAVAKQLP